MTKDDSTIQKRTCRYCNGEQPLENFPLHMNRWAYTPETLTEAVRAAGFTRVEILPAQHHNPARDLRLEARP